MVQRMALCLPATAAAAADGDGWNGIFTPPLLGARGGVITVIWKYLLIVIKRGLGNGERHLTRADRTGQTAMED